MNHQQAQEVTNRQLAASVRFGRRIEISTPDLEEGEPISGYVAGFDGETIFLAIPEDDEIRKVLVHRDGYSHIELPDESTMRFEPPVVREKLNRLLGRFRDRIVDDYFR